MDGKGKNVQQNESSLLLQLPNSMLSFNEMNASPLLMPVAVEKLDDTQSHGFTPNSTFGNGGQSSKSTAPTAKSICQLQQPLLMQKSSSNNSLQTSVSQAYPNPPTSSHIRSSPVDDSQAECSRPSAGSETRFFDHKSCLDDKESLKCAQFEQLEVAPLSVSGNSNIEIVSSKSVSSPAFYSNLGENHSEIPNLYPRPSGEATRSLSASEIAASVSLSHDSKYFQMSPNNSFPNISQCNIPNQSGLYYSYVPVKPYWLFEDTIESREVWYGFSENDSEKLESAFVRGDNSVVHTDGGRYDVYIDKRIKKSVYFDSKDLPVLRGTWFYHNGTSSRCQPYTEEVAEILEEHFSHCINSGQWQQRFNISGIGSFVFENEQVMLHYKNELQVWPTLSDSKANPKIAKRGLPDGFEIMPNESSNIDHLVFIVQGIGSFCDLRFRTVSQCVDGFRDIAYKLIGTHFKKEVEQGLVRRVEFLPVAWHAKLHTSDAGLDRRMQKVTLPSIPKLRHFTNDTLIDILLYSSPSYCQSILDTVACELNKLYELFLSRNPNFSGQVFVAGHSLGSLILFDILANQNTSESDIPCQKEDRLISEENQTMMVDSCCKNPDSALNNSEPLSVESLLESLDLNDYIEVFNNERIDFEALALLTQEDLKNLGLPVGPQKKLLKAIVTKQNQTSKIEVSAISFLSASQQVNISDEVIYNSLENNTVMYPAQVVKSGMSLIVYPRLKFQPVCFFALGSPISMFLAIRGYDAISENFRFPTCSSFFHIFHPYDPVAFRIEPLIDPNFSAKPVLIPHHKGRKRMHLEIRENVTKLASEIKQKLMDTMRYTWNSLSEFAKNHSFPSAVLEAEVEKLVEQEMSETVETQESSSEDVKIGLLNGGRRIDYVLQEKPIEALNDYVFALTSHATYWNSEDTVLMILQEIYATQGIFISNQQMEQTVLSIQNRESFDKSASLDSVALMDAPESSLNIQNIFNYNQTFYMPTESTSVISHQNSNFKPPNLSNLPPVMPTAKSSQVSSSIPGSNHIGPPPLSGFVKQSPFAR